MGCKARVTKIIVNPGEKNNSNTQEPLLRGRWCLKHCGVAMEAQTGECRLGWGRGFEETDLLWLSDAHVVR